MKNDWKNFAPKSPGIMLEVLAVGLLPFLPERKTVKVSAAVDFSNTRPIDQWNYKF